MTISERIEAFSILGEKIANLSEEDLKQVTGSARAENAWFTPESTTHALHGIQRMLDRDTLTRWLQPQNFHEPEVPAIVGIVMAGNIPLVGFHDLMCVLLTGHFAAVKTSTQDHALITIVLGWLLEAEPRLKKNVQLCDRLNHVDAVIATGSDNTARYFEYYFRNKKRIIRKNRTSLAVLSGTETTTELSELGKDLFLYFGLGCRNVSKLLVPAGYDFRVFFESIEPFGTLRDHHKYVNNYDYYKSLFLINQTPHLDNGFVLLLPTRDLVSPVSVIYTQEYSGSDALQSYLTENTSKIQCIVGKEYLPFGTAQLPDPWDYADGVNTIAFLADL